MALIIIKVRGMMAIAWRVGHAKELIGLRGRSEVREVHGGSRLPVLADAV